MLSGEGNENGKKTAIGPISKKSNFARAAHFFVHFFAVVLHDCNVKRPETSWLQVLWRKCRTCSCSLFFFTVAHFHPGGRQHPAATKFHVVLPTKNVSLYFLSLALAPFLVELCWPVALLSLFLCLSFSLYLKFVDMTINLSLIL